MQHQSQAESATRCTVAICGRMWVSVLNPESCYNVMRYVCIILCARGNMLIGSFQFKIYSSLSFQTPKYIVNRR